MALVLVCGGRDYGDRQRVFAVLDAVHRKHPDLSIIEGGARGADSLARLWADHRGVSVTTIPADWNAHGRRAGPIRNAEMLAMSPVGVVAFPGGRGTADMVQRSEEAGIPVMRA